MKLKNNKGYVITDVSISIIILLILVPVIMGMVYKTETTKRATESKAEAINIAVNTLEAAKGIGVTDLVDTVVDENVITAKKLIFEKIKEDVYNEKISFEENNTQSAVINDTKGSYMILLEITDFATSEDASEDVRPNIVKTVKVTVRYKVNGEEKEINLSTVLK